MQQRETPAARPASAGESKPPGSGADAARAEMEAEIAALREELRGSRVRAQAGRARRMERPRTAEGAAAHGGGSVRARRREGSDKEAVPG